MDRLYRSESDKVLSGVCGGIAEKYGLDPALVRLATILIIMTAGIGLPLYIAAWIVIPPESELEKHSESEEPREEKSEESKDDS